MGNGNLAVQRAQRCCMQGFGRQEKGHQVNITSREPTGRDIKNKQVDDRVCGSHHVRRKYSLRMDGRTGGLTQKLDGQLLKKGFSGLTSTISSRQFRGRIPSQIQQLQVSKTLARQLASYIDLLPSLEVLGRGPVAMESTVWLSQGANEMRLDHCSSLQRGFHSVLTKAQGGRDLGGGKGLGKV